MRDMNFLTPIDVPDGEYVGVWSGFTLRSNLSDGREFLVNVNAGIRGTATVAFSVVNGAVDARTIRSESMPASPKYPKIRVKLVGEDRNAFCVLLRVIEALRKNGLSQQEIGAFRKEASSGDYKTLLQTCMAWVEVE